MSAAEVARRWAETAEELRKDLGGPPSLIEASLLSQTWATLSIAESLEKLADGRGPLDVRLVDDENFTVVPR